MYWARNYWQAELAGVVRCAGFRVTGRAWVGQTFENISGHQPRWVAAAAPVLRALVRFQESIPVLRRFCASQVVFARKP